MQTPLDNWLPARIGPYVPLRFIRSGGFSSIIAARHEKSGQRVALRILFPRYKFNWGLRHNFLHGAKLLRSLNHPNWLVVMESGKSHGLIYTAMELIDSGTLGNLILEQAETLRNHAMPVMLGTARGLSHLHARGWLHLDFKPENVLIKAPWQPILIDLDLARRLPRKREKGKRVRRVPGTPAYMAPELLQNHRISERSDVFAFGVTCFEILTFHKPWGTTPQELSLAYSKREGQPPLTLRYWNPTVSPALAGIIHRCIQLNPEDRYPTIHMVLRDLERIGDQTLVHSDPKDPLFDTVMLRSAAPVSTPPPESPEPGRPQMTPKPYWVKKQPGGY